MKSNNKAFTLIELLAIIVILAIIAVITVPIVANIRKQAHEASMVDSAYGYVDAVNKLYFSNSLNSVNSEIDDGTYTVAQLKTMGITVNGREPSEGCVVLEDGNVSNYSLKFGDYAVNYNSTNKTAIAEKNGELNGCASTIQYGYKSYDLENDTETEIVIGTSGYIATGKNVYLKYALTNGVVAEETNPEVCLYSDTYGGELCLKKDEFEISTQKIKDYFGYKATGEGAWSEDSLYGLRYWFSPDRTVHCEFTTGMSGCQDSIVLAYAFDLGYVYTVNLSMGFYCQSRYGDFSCGVSS